jgi:hypothetical protein
MNLAREADIWCEFSLLGKTISLQLCRRRDIASQNLDPTGCATGVATTAMHDVDSRILNGQHQLFARFNLE